MGLLILTRSIKDTTFQSMNNILISSKKYWLTITGLAIYAWLWYNVLALDARFKADVALNKNGGLVSLGEAVMLGYFYVAGIGIGAGILSVILAFVNKEKIGFYLTVSILYFLPVLLFISFSIFFK